MILLFFYPLSYLFLLQALCLSSLSSFSLSLWSFYFDSLLSRIPLLLLLLPSHTPNHPINTTRIFIIIITIIFSTIVRSSPPSPPPSAIVRWGLRMPSGVSVDWINDHVYWLDGITMRIEVANLDGWVALVEEGLILLLGVPGVWRDCGIRRGYYIKRLSLLGCRKEVMILLFWCS